MGDNHPSSSGKPNHMWTHVDQDQVVLGVIQLLGEGLSDRDTSTTTAEDDDILRWRRGRHGEGSGRRADVNIEGTVAYI